MTTAAGRWVLLTTVLGSGIVMIDSTVVNVALRSARSNLGAPGMYSDEHVTGWRKVTDARDGPVENRARLMFEVLFAVIDVWGPDRVGLRVSPSGTYGDMSDSDPGHTFGYVARRADAIGLAYLQIIEPRVRGNETLAEEAEPVASADLRRDFSGSTISAGGFEPRGAEAIVESGAADLIAFGRLFRSNPDLPQRIKSGQPLTHHDHSTVWSGTERGYIDFPTYMEMHAKQPA
ncbi:oxidoreductase [Mycobacterium sp. C31M]